jgi:hypothetical protein
MSIFVAGNTHWIGNMSTPNCRVVGARPCRLSRSPVRGGLVTSRREVTTSRRRRPAGEGPSQTFPESTVLRCRSRALSSTSRRPYCPAVGNLQPDSILRSQTAFDVSMSGSTQLTLTNYLCRGESGGEGQVDCVQNTLSALVHEDALRGERDVHQTQKLNWRLGPVRHSGAIGTSQSVLLVAWDEVTWRSHHHHHHQSWNSPFSCLLQARSHVAQLRHPARDAVVCPPSSQGSLMYWPCEMRKTTFSFRRRNGTALRPAPLFLAVCSRHPCSQDFLGVWTS